MEGAQNDSRANSHNKFELNPISGCFEIHETLRGETGGPGNPPTSLCENSKYN